MVLAQLAEGLAFLHARGVIHRDVKPSNAIVTDGAVKLLDFGLALEQRRVEQELSRETRVVGTAAYLAPEYVERLIVSPAMDVDEALGRVRLDGSPDDATWRGRCYERERVPYRAFDFVIDDLATELAGTSVLVTQIEHAGAIARVFPTLGTLLEDAPKLPVADDLDYSDGTFPPVNKSRLLIHPPGSWATRPEPGTAIPNLVLAGDYIRTKTDLAPMEGANEAARHAVNVILQRAGSVAQPCQLWPLVEPESFVKWKHVDAALYAHGKKHMFEIAGIRDAARAADLLRRFYAFTGIDRIDDLLEKVKVTSVVKGILARLGVD